APVQDAATGLISYQDTINSLDGLAEFDVRYRQLPYDVLPDSTMRFVGSSEVQRYVKKEYHFAEESYSLPGMGYEWDVKEQDPKGPLGKLANLPLPEGPSIKRPIIELRYTWTWVPEPLNIAAFARVLGCINNSPFDGYLQTFLLCQPPQVSER